MPRSANAVRLPRSPLPQSPLPESTVPAADASAAIPPARTRRTSRSTRTAVTPIPLGSLTQNGAREGVLCKSCHSERVTALAMTLTDGTPVRFLSCHRCEERSWLDLDGNPLPVDRVLDKTRKLR